MKIVLLGHADVASLYALDLVLNALPEHGFDVFLSGPVTSAGDAHPAMQALAAVDAELCGRFRERADERLRSPAELPAPNSAAGLETLSACAPDLVISIRYRRILKDDAIAIPRHGVINLHSGLLPDYRGVMATFWAMLAREREIGCTLHGITDAGIDTGPVIDERRLAADYGASYLANVLRLYRPGCERVAAAAKAVAAGRPPGGRRQPSGDGRYFTTPDRDAVQRFLDSGLVLADGREMRELEPPGPTGNA